MNHVNGNNVKSITAEDSKVTKPSLRHRLLRQTTTNYNLPCVAPHYNVITVKHKSISIQYYECTFVLIIRHAKCILTSNIIRSKAISIKYYYFMYICLNYPACKSNFLRAMLCSMMYGLFGSDVFYVITS
jgi:hypothetical protein